MADAEVKIGADASAVERAAGVAIDAWRGAGGSIQSALSGVARSLADVALAAGKVNFGSQHEQVKAFETSTAHLAVAMGRDLESIRGKAEAVGVAIGKRPLEVVAWQQEVGRLSYSFDDLEESIKATAGLAAQTGRSVDDYKGLSVELRRMGVAGKDTADVLGTMVSQANELHSSGGIAALADQFQAAEEAATRFSDRGLRGAKELSAFIASFSKNEWLDSATAGRVSQQALGTLTGDPRRWERYLGRHIVDDKGHLEDPSKTFQDIYSKMAKTYKDPEMLRTVAMNNFGPELGMAIIHGGKTGGFADAKRLAGLPASSTSGDALKTYMGTDAGKRDAAESQLAVSSRALMGSSTALGRAADALQQFASNNPVTSTFGASAAGAAVSSAAGSIFKAGKSLLGFGGAAAAAEGGGVAAGIGAAGVGAAAAAGAAVAVGAIAGGTLGMWVDKKTGWTDKVFGTGKGSQHVMDEKDRAGIDSKIIAQAVKEGMQSATVNVINSSGGTTDATINSSQGPYSGDQSQ